MPSNDPLANPYRVNFIGQVFVPEPEISLLFGGANIESGAEEPVALGFAPVAAQPLSKSFTIRNDGGVPLTVSQIASVGPFVVSPSAGGVIGVGETFPFTVTLPTGQNVGVYEAAISITSDDSDEGLFTFGVRGTVAQPGPGALRVSAGGVEYRSGKFEEIYFGRAELGGAELTRTLLLSNLGTEPLTFFGFDFPTPFEPLSDLPSSLDAGEHASILVTMATSDEGTHAGKVRVTSNDRRSPVYSVRLLGAACTLSPLRPDLGVGFLFPAQPSLPNLTLRTPYELCIEQLGTYDSNGVFVSGANGALNGKYVENFNNAPLLPLINRSTNDFRLNIFGDQQVNPINAVYQGTDVSRYLWIQRFRQELFSDQFIDSLGMDAQFTQNIKHLSYRPDFLVNPGNTAPRAGKPKIGGRQLFSGTALGLSLSPSQHEMRYDFITRDASVYPLTY